MISDGLQCFGRVKDAGCSHQVIMTGSGPGPVRGPAFKWVNTALGNIKSAIVGTYRSINPVNMCPATSPSSMPASNRRYDLAAMIPRLTWAGVRTPPMPYHLLKLAEVHA